MQQIKIADCSEESGRKGEGFVSVWFERSGEVSRVVIDGPPFEGTRTGEGVAARYRAVRMPPFSGEMPPFSGEEGRLPTSFRIE
jgi:hypothetical protein